jgi:hypothetical protein
VKSNKKKPILAWIVGVALSIAVPSAIVGKSAWNEIRAKVESNKSFVTSLVKDHYEGKDISSSVVDIAQADVVKSLDEARTKLGKCVSYDSIDTVPSFNDAISKGWELTYNLPVQFEKGYKTFTFRVRNEGFSQKVIWMTAIDGITARQSIKRQIKQQIPK